LSYTYSPVYISLVPRPDLVVKLWEGFTHDTVSLCYHDNISTAMMTERSLFVWGEELYRIEQPRRSMQEWAFRRTCRATTKASRC